MTVGGGLFRKYLVLIGGFVSLTLLVGAAAALYVLGRDHTEQLHALQQEKARSAADRIHGYVQSLAQQVAGAAPPPGGTPSEALQERQTEYARLMRRLPAVRELQWVDRRGREQLRLSRVRMDRVGAGEDHAQAPHVLSALAGRPHFSPVEFHEGSEPHMRIALPAGGADGGVVVAEVNLKLAWEVVSGIRSGRTGYAYVVDGAGRLIAHPDLLRVLRDTTLEALPQVRASLEGRSAPREPVPNADGREVLAAAAPVPGPGWHVLVELPAEEAFAPLRTLVWRGAALIALGLCLCLAAGVLLARGMVRPIRALQAGARAIGAGDLDHRITVRTGDEIEALAEQFNTMARQLKAQYAGLEEKVAQRTAELSEQRRVAEAANHAKSRFLAAASHDLRQPMHALNLYLASLANLPLPDAPRRVLQHARECAQSLDALFDSLLDISRLDARAISPQLQSVDPRPLLQRLRLQFEAEAAGKGNTLHVAFARAAPISTDPHLLERLLRNLLSNAVRYTEGGRILVCCRRRGERMRIAVHDTGIGIAAPQQELVFEEFYQVGNPSRDRSEGLGLGLSIVRRLANLLGTEVRLASSPGRGSCFWLELPVSNEPAVAGPDPAQAARLPAQLRVVVVDDEEPVLEATRTLLQQWGCDVVAATSGDEAVAALAAAGCIPDLLLCDWRLREAETGLEVIERLRDEFNRPIPALLVTGDVASVGMPQGAPDGLQVLHKPVSEARLRGAMEKLLAPAVG